VKKRTARERTERKTGWRSEVLLFLESEDPRVLDKETYKIFCRLRETAANLKGPIPLPVRRSSASAREAGVHRRLFKIFFPTEKTISLLEKLPLSGSVHASINVEEADA